MKKKTKHSIKYILFFLLTAGLATGVYFAVAGLGGTPQGGLMLYYNMDSNDANGAVIYDKSGQGNNGAIHTKPTCPTGYVFVPGNSTYNTSDFCVMQYEAKYDSNVDGTGDDAPSNCKYDINYDTWDWGKDVATGCGYNVNESARVVSTAAGSPIAGITHTQALASCPAGDHIITNDEWMTIARDIEQVNANWTNGTVGSGCLFRGNSGETTCGYDGANPEKGTGRNARAKFTLSSGEEIYDISGNVLEHVKVDASDTLISLAEQPEATDGVTNPLSDSDGFNWSDFTTGGGLSRWLVNNGTEPPLGYDVFRPSNSSWNASQGMGRIYHSSNSANATETRVFLRGGGWGYGTYAGAFALYLDWNTATQYYYVGFRCSR